MAVDAAVVGIEVAGLPFEAGRGSLLGVVARIIDTDGQHVPGIAEAHVVGDVQAVGGDAVLVERDIFAVKEDLPGLAHAFELEEELAPCKLSGSVKCLRYQAGPM